MEEEAIPFPNEDKNPPITKMCLVKMILLFLYYDVNKLFVEKFGSVVRLTPIRRKPASSPGEGI